MGGGNTDLGDSSEGCGQKNRIVWLRGRKETALAFTAFQHVTCFSPEFCTSLLEFYLFLSSLQCRLCLVCAGGAAGGSGQTLQEKPLSSR